MMRKKMSAEEIEKGLNNLPGWNLENDNLKKRFEFKDFAESIGFVNQVGAIAEQMDHHPDIFFGWGYAKFSITTHDCGGLTEKDFALAEKIEELLTADKRG